MSLYSYDQEEDIYTKTTNFDETLSADLRFATGVSARNVGEYSVYAENIESTNFDVIFGQTGTLSSYVVRVLPKELTYKVTGVSKTFDNTYAVLNYADASEI